MHAIRNLARIGFGTVAVRWSQLGFGRTSTTSTAQSTPRNLFGFKDGTANVKAEEAEALEDYVWVQRRRRPDGADWLAGGSYLVARRINMTIEVWDRQPLADQEEFVGRTKDSGAPLSGGEEFTEPDFADARPEGPVIPRDAHIRIVHPTKNDGARMLRRGYNFVDGSDALGGLDAGLFFIAFVRDPETQFIPMQNRMAQKDALMEYLKFTSSAIFAVPPGAGPGEYVGQALFTDSSAVLQRGKSTDPQTKRCSAFARRGRGGVRRRVGLCGHSVVLDRRPTGPRQVRLALRDSETEVLAVTSAHQTRPVVLIAEELSPATVEALGPGLRDPAAATAPTAASCSRRSSTSTRSWSAPRPRWTPRRWPRPAASRSSPARASVSTTST